MPKDHEYICRSLHQSRDKSESQSEGDKGHDILIFLLAYHTLQNLFFLLFLFSWIHTLQLNTKDPQINGAGAKWIGRS